MAFLTWLRGRKTYILAGVVLATVAVLVFCGQLTAEAAYTILVAAVAGFAVTFRSALAEHQAQVISALRDVGQLGIAVRSHDKQAELAAAEDLGKQAMTAAAADKQALSDYLTGGGAEQIVKAIDAGAAKGPAV